MLLFVLTSHGRTQLRLFIFEQLNRTLCSEIFWWALRSLIKLQNLYVSEK